MTESNVLITVFGKRWEMAVSAEEQGIFAKGNDKGQTRLFR